MTRVADVDIKEEARTSDTRRLIADISDEGLFERLAAFALRISEPLYRGLCDTGTNALGRTIADPADGIVYSESPSGERYAIVAHHTITDRRRLRGKWLDPERGDVAKALELFERSNDRIGGYKRRLVLSCSTVPTARLSPISKLPPSVTASKSIFGQEPGLLTSWI